MDATASLVDLAPITRMMLLGIVIAIGPLAWIWLRHRQASPAQRLRVLTLVTLFLTFDLVLFGAFTRLTDSGLGCPDWPGCYGAASPFGAHADISAAQSAMPTGPVTFSKAWIEMIHRYLATGVGVLIIVLAAGSWIERRRLHVHWVWPVVTLVWVCLQGAFGALTVTMKLFPAIVTLHLLGGLVLLALLRAQAVAYRLGETGSAGPVPIGAAQRWALLAAFALVWLQIALGGWVSTNYAVLACRDFPTCQGSWWPTMNLGEGFTLWRELGANHVGEAITFPALTAIHYVHRLTAYAVFAALLALAWTLWRVPGLERFARALVVLCAWQFLTGLSNVVLDWPLLAAVSHTGGAAALVIAFTGAVAATRGRPAPAARWRFTEAAR
ncbi:MAG: heme A synthase [Hydrogenophaga sp.]|uniref:COX15/CtaA family protein n=1 Tax=Hydrogenophaga sp. TaxID=1904254 RepID=UPI0016A9FD03|nr:COX15/CtaA family protein [Hydrogenophaga sp.]NIM42775.1 heme A synthase [Hydrogenophaga sp.]NIN25818.1 heme A synthase [Hydrogenophaga sp.]NIN30480.1 heme A synthase [Hydrogenophaga sp.]NIN56820.1 heme A synthase [Hydrogenophaga sp.]NIO53395.1 heme A synthase [Hydrogenophaga sp.]